MLAWVYLGLSCLEFSQILKFVGSCLFAKFGKFFIHYVFEYVFSSALFLFSFQDSVDMNGSSFVIVTKVPEALFTFFSLFFFCCSDWVISIVLSSSSLILPSVCSIPMLSPSIEFLIPVVFFSFKVFNLILIYIFYFFAKTFCFFAEISLFFY